MGKVSSYSVPSRFRADLQARPDGPSLRMDGMGYQKCHSMFFILFGYIVHITQKSSPTFLRVSQFDVKLGWGSNVSKLQQVGDLLDQTDSAAIKNITQN